MICQFSLQAFASAKKIGHEITSYVNEPAICPAMVDVRQIVNCAGKSLAFVEFRLRIAIDCNGDTKIRNTAI